jgi:hypothetical protein
MDTEETKKRELADIKEKMSWSAIFDAAKCLEFYEGNFNSQESTSIEGCWFCGFPHNNENDTCACHNMEMTWFKEECMIEDYWQNQNDF